MGAETQFYATNTDHCVCAEVIVQCFTDGARVARPKLRETEADVLAHALWLEKHGASEQAEWYLEEYLQRNSSATCH